MQGNARETRATDVLQRLRHLCLSLPEASEAASWGHPNFRAGKRTFVAFEWVDGRPSIAFRLDSADIDLLVQRRAFFATPYGRGYWVSLWADGRLSWKLVETLVDRAYRLVALKRMLAALDTGSPGPEDASTRTFGRRRRPAAHRSVSACPQSSRS